MKLQGASTRILLRALDRHRPAPGRRCAGAWWRSCNRQRPGSAAQRKRAKRPQILPVMLSLFPLGNQRGIQRRGRVCRAYCCWQRRALQRLRDLCKADGAGEGPILIPEQLLAGGAGGTSGQSCPLGRRAGRVPENATRRKQPWSPYRVLPLDKFTPVMRIKITAKAVYIPVRMANKLSSGTRPRRVDTNSKLKLKAK